VSDVPDIYGVWCLQSYYLENMETAERTEVFGPTPNGVLDSASRRSHGAIITPTEQRQPATEADEASAFRNLIAYSGLSSG
jgi:Lipocalin-like domain